MNKLKPISIAPKDRDILIAWGSKGCGCEGFTVGRLQKEFSFLLSKHVETWVNESGMSIERNGHCIFGWTELPEMSEEIVA